MTIVPAARVVVQRRRRQSPEKANATKNVVKNLPEENLFLEAQYTICLSNIVLVKKHNEKWRMYVDYTDLNKACPKDAYLLPNIDRLVDDYAGFKLLSFMDVYSRDNQILMEMGDKKYTAFIAESDNYYNLMPFGLKNTDAIFQQMMNKVFRGEMETCSKSTWTT